MIRPAARTVRCAVYTRKSTDEGLEQDFNSLDAQREAAEAFIVSQRSEGWTCLPDRYDDGGYTGGNMDRPALKKLLVDVEAGRVDCVVVYKVDRLSRSLLDFTRIIETFDRAGASFVSVTQQFNTTTSMGRLTLNILLSFAQFEREIISERTRDKIAAARRKGKWSGGRPVLGYDVAPEGGRLLVNEDEAARVRAVFELYLDQGGLIPTIRELDRRGWTTKRWVTRKGATSGGRPFTKGSLHLLLTNVLYRGKITLGPKVYDGEHPAIVDAKLFRRVQKRLAGNGRAGAGSGGRNRSGALLRGLVFCSACGHAMTHTFAVKNRTRRYRYYACLTARNRGAGACTTGSVPAAEIEKFVVGEIRAVARDRRLLAETLRQAGEEALRQRRELEAEDASLGRELARLHRELASIAGQAPADGLAELQERIARAELRRTEVRAALARLDAGAPDQAALAAAFESFDPVWEMLSPRERERVLRLLVKRVDYDAGKGTVALTFHDAGLRTLAEDLVTEEKAS